MFKKLAFMALVFASFAKVSLANISIFPYYVNFDAQSKKKVQSIRVVNTSNEVQTYRVSFVNFAQKEDGSLTEIKETDKSASPFLMWSPRQFTLKPREVQTINLARKGLAQAPDGELVSHLKVSETEIGSPDKDKNEPGNTISLNLKALFAITIPVTITKGNNLVEKTDIESYKLSDKGLTVKIKREGNVSSHVNVVVVDSKNQEIGRVNGVKVYAPNKFLTTVVPLEKKSNLKKAIIRLENVATKKEILRKYLAL